MSIAAARASKSATAYQTERARVVSVVSASAEYRDRKKAVEVAEAKLEKLRDAGDEARTQAAKILLEARSALNAFVETEISKDQSVESARRTMLDDAQSHATLKARWAAGIAAETTKNLERSREIDQAVRDRERRLAVARRPIGVLQTEGYGLLQQSVAIIQIIDDTTFIGMYRGETVWVHG